MQDYLILGAVEQVCLDPRSNVLAGNKNRKVRLKLVNSLCEICHGSHIKLNFCRFGQHNTPAELCFYADSTWGITKESEDKTSTVWTIAKQAIGDFYPGFEITYKKLTIPVTEGPFAWGEYVLKFRTKKRGDPSYSAT